MPNANVKRGKDPEEEHSSVEFDDDPLGIYDSDSLKESQKVILKAERELLRTYLEWIATHKELIATIQSHAETLSAQHLEATKMAERAAGDILGRVSEVKTYIEEQCRLVNEARLKAESERDEARSVAAKQSRWKLWGNEIPGSHALIALVAILFIVLLIVVILVVGHTSLTAPGVTLGALSHIPSLYP